MIEWDGNAGEWIINLNNEYVSNDEKDIFRTAFLQILVKTFIMSFPVSFINTRKTAFYGFSVQIHERMLVVKDGENTIGHMKRQIK